MQTETPRLTVFVTSYNKGKYIERAVRSCAEQSAPPASIVVLEDCSTDDSVAVLEALQPSVPSLRLIRYSAKSDDWMTDLLGHAGTLAETPYVYLLGGDDYPRPGFFEAAQAGMDAGCGVIIANQQNTQASGQPICESRHSLSPGLHRQGDDLHRWVRSPAMPGGAGVMLSREALLWLRDAGADRLGPWFDSIGYPAAAWAFGIYYLPEVYAVFLHDVNNYGGSNRPAEQKRRERPGAEAFFAEASVKERLPPDLCFALLSKVR